MKELDDSKKVSINKKGVFSSQKERTDMVRNILHRRIFISDFLKNQKSFQGKRLIQQTPRKDFKGKLSQRCKQQPSCKKKLSSMLIFQSCELIDEPDQAIVPSPMKFTKLEEEAINKEILDFTKKGIIEPVVQADPDEFISSIFVRQKSDGGIRVILNLKPFHQRYVDKIHFKIESLKSVINAMTTNCFLSSVDLKEAFYSIRIREIARKYFCFYCRGQNTNLLL